ncbi:MAG: endo-1,4-beta-xylanase [Oscillospiraceae bacterium]|nr:endo-1,4-beta-xylanase [Oscillospiraceae bacterium]
MLKQRLPAAALCLITVLALISSGQLLPAAKAFDLPRAGLNYDQYPALREVYEDYFLVGTIDRFGAPVRSEFMAYTYNAVTAENSMKPSSTQNQKGVFTFDPARASLNAAREHIGGVRLIGHTLAWHSQSPNWLWDAPGFDRDTALQNLNAHIDGVFGEFGGQLQAVDVVNEAIGSLDPDDPENWRFALEKGEGWALALGWEWVELAFLRAAKVADENGWDCKLYYNDFGLNSESKARVIYEMVKDINERYEGRRPNGKPLIEGVGFQEHYNSNTKVGDVEASVALIAALPGVSISFTELDIEYLNAGLLTSQQAISQAQQYARLFQIFKKYAAGPANTTGHPKVIERVTFWGTDDGGSWKASGLPLLFNAPEDGQITAKEALLGALWPDEYLQRHPVSEEGGEAEDIYVPGVYVFSLNRGDTWGGANILLGTSAGEWPWSTAQGGDQQSDGRIAFVPEKDETYRLTVNYTALGTAGVRVRWIKDNTNGSYTSRDGQVVNEDPHNRHLSFHDVATIVPALFNGGMVNSGTYTLVTDVLMDGSQPAEGLIGNLAVRGYQGGNAFDINWLKMENIRTGEVMFVWDPLNPPEPDPEPTPEPTLSPTPEPSEPAASPPAETPAPPASGDGDSGLLGFLLLAVSMAGLAAAAVVLLRKKRGKGGA